VDNVRVVSRRFTQRLEQAAYPEAQAILAGTSDENRERLIYGFASGDNAVAIAANWAQACPGSSLAHTVLGASLIVSGWNIRGGSYSDNVEEGAWKPFLDKLKDAQEPLRIAARLDPSTADPYAWLIHAELGAGGAREQLDALFSEAVMRSPLHWPSHYKYFLATTEKWGGSHRDMFKFAEDVSQRAPRGSILHSLVAGAYTEFALALGPKSWARIRTKENAAKVVNALQNWLDASASTTGDKLERVGGGFSSYALNHFAVACYLCGANAQAKELLAALNGEIERVPWGWIASGVRERLNPGFVYDRALRELADVPQSRR
jgi:hypothetical protein